MVYLWEEDRSLYVDLTTDLFHTLCDVPTPPPSQSNTIIRSPRFLACEAVAHLRHLGISTVVEACALGQRLIDDALIRPATNAPIPNGFANAHHVYRFTVSHPHEIAKSAPPPLPAPAQRRTKSHDSMYNFSEASFNEDEPLALRQTKEDPVEEDDGLYRGELFPVDANNSNWRDKSIEKRVRRTNEYKEYDVEHEVQPNNSDIMNIRHRSTRSKLNKGAGSLPRQDTWHGYLRNRSGRPRGLRRPESFKAGLLGRRVRVRSNGFEPKTPESVNIQPVSKGIGPLDAPYTTECTYSAGMNNTNNYQAPPSTGNEFRQADTPVRMNTRELRTPRRFRMPSLRRMFGKAGDVLRKKGRG